MFVISSQRDSPPKYIANTKKFKSFHALFDANKETKSTITDDNLTTLAKTIYRATGAQDFSLTRDIIGLLETDNFIKILKSKNYDTHTIVEQLKVAAINFTCEKGLLIAKEYMQILKSAGKENVLKSITNDRSALFETKSIAKQLLSV